MPVEVPVWERFFLSEKGEEVLTIEYFACWGRDVSCSEDGGEEVEVGDGGFVADSGFNLSRPREKKGFSDSAFVVAAFACTQREVGSDTIVTAVIGGEDEKGIFKEVLFR